jgi:hypothetical protein
MFAYSQQIKLNFKPAQGRRAASSVTGNPATPYVSGR